MEKVKCKCGWSGTKYHVLVSYEGLKCPKCEQIIADEAIPEEENDKDDWQPCDNCDLPDACADFGCAIKSGVRKNYPIDGVF